jgi:hypothetical protein
MALAYLRLSIVEIFHAHLQMRQKPHPPGLRSDSVERSAAVGAGAASFF